MNYKWQDWMFRTLLNLTACLSHVMTFLMLVLKWSEHKSTKSSSQRRELVTFRLTDELCKSVPAYRHASLDRMLVVLSTIVV